MAQKLILVVLLATALVAAACGRSDSTGASPGYTDISVSELQKMLEDEELTLVNTHIPFEGNIAGTDVSIPYNEISGKLDQLPANKDAKLVLYCRSGSMSTDAATTLVESGYTNVFELDGGMIAWEKAGLPLLGR